MAKERVGTAGPAPAPPEERAALGNTDKRGAETEIDYTGPPILPEEYRASIGRFWDMDIVPLIVVKAVEVADLRLCIEWCRIVRIADRAYADIEEHGETYLTPQKLQKDRPSVKRYRDAVSTLRMLSPSIGAAKGARARLAEAPATKPSAQGAAGEAFLNGHNGGE